MPNIQFRKQSKVDLLGIYVYLGEQNIRAAKRFLRAVRADVSKLSEMPGL